MGLGGVREVRRELEFLARVLGCVAHDPGDVWFGQADDEAEGLLGGGVVFHPTEIVRVGGGADAAGVEAFHGIERKSGIGFDVNFSCNADAVTEGAEVVGETAGFGAACGVVPGAAVAHGVLAGVKLGPAGLAHRAGEVSLIESETTSRECVEIRLQGPRP